MKLSKAEKGIKKVDSEELSESVKPPKAEPSDCSNNHLTCDGHALTDKQRQFGPESFFRHDLSEKKCGYLYKRGKMREKKTKRYFVLDGTVLSNQRSDKSGPTWQLSLVGCGVKQGTSDPCELHLHFPNKSLTLYAESKQENQEWLDAFHKAANNKVDNFYKLEEQIGKGAFGIVRNGTCLETGNRVAIKIIRKPQEAKREFIEREAKIVRSLQHINIVPVFDVFETEERLYIVMELLEGGDLEDRLSQIAPLSEYNISRIVREILNGIEYLHSQNIVHRDIKPENFLCTSRHWPFSVKIADFGFANFIKKDEKIDNSQHGHVMKTQVGTPCFLAPELAKGLPYGKEVDMWSTGVLVYNMICGKLPFTGSVQEVLGKVINQNVTFPEEDWRHISESCRDFIINLLQRDPSKRLTASEALKHPWVQESEPCCEVEHDN